MDVTPSTYWHTLRHLRPSQFYWRLWYHAYRPGVNLAPAPALREGASTWIAPPSRAPSMVGQQTFRLLNVTRALTEPDANGPDSCASASLPLCTWDDSDIDKLWRFHLHYFEDLIAEDAESRADWHRALIQRWVRDNPPASGTGWEPYPVSRRIVNWIQWAFAGNNVPAEFAQSLAEQARWLVKKLEFQHLGNHLLVNAKALVFAGVFFDGSEAARWQRRGLQILDAELDEQVLPDGGHFERSPMYHALVLLDLLDVYNLLEAYPPVVGSRAHVVRTRIRARIALMNRWLDAMCHPDGEISFFNDAAFDMAPSPAQLMAYSARLGIPRRANLAGADVGNGPDSDALICLRDSGYVRLRTGPAVALLDVGRIGPDHQLAHAHADTLSFELSIDENRVFVNSGTSVYGTGQERQRQRGTAAHNTVELGGVNSSEVWSGFRVARRAYPVGLKWQTSEDGGWLRCGHDGYARLPGRPVHIREWRWNRESLVVEDRIEGRADGAVARFYLHPSVVVLGSFTPVADVQEAKIRLPTGRVVRLQVSGASPRWTDTHYHPEFGSSIANKCLTMALHRDRCELRIEWS